MKCAVSYSSRFKDRTTKVVRGPALNKSTSLRVFSLFIEQKRIAAVLLALVVFAAGLDIAVPFITQHLIDTLIRFFQSGGANPVPVLLTCAGGVLIATVLNRAIKSVYDYHLFKTATRLEDCIKNRTFEKYLRCTRCSIRGRIAARSWGG
jgi:ABC-type bacteriocin/lantibiotic exporter with double-glycine peptidase domain